MLADTIWLTLNTLLFVCGNPVGETRERRCIGHPCEQNTDYAVMHRYWDEVLPLGFFINGDSDTGDSPAAAPGGLSVRDRIQQDGGSGGGPVARRDDIQHPKPTEAMALKSDVAQKLADEKIEKLDGENKAKIEKSQAPVVASDDPGDKTKVRKSVTCQGQKEWIQCDGPYELIKMKSAFWGRDDTNTCTKNGVTHGLRTDKMCAQDEANTMNKVKEACDSENVCEVVASGIYFDKVDCNDVYKYLTMEWQCAPSESRIKESITK